MGNREKDILKRIKEIVRGKDPSAKIYIYGSRARGTANSESDWDLLILLNQEKISAEIEKEITYSLYDLEFEIGELISPMLYTEKDWNIKYSVSPFYKNVMKDSRLL